jgi:hypothetical protein
MYRPPFVHIDGLADIHFGVPEVMNCDPEPSASSVEEDALIIFEAYYLNGVHTPVWASLSATVNGVAAVTAGVIQPGFDGPRSGTILHSVNRRTFTLDPTTLEGLSTYTICVQFTTTDAVPCDTSWSFTTEDVNGPVLSSVTPTGRRSLLVKYLQSVASGAVAVSVSFPWGDQSLALADGLWGLSPLSYPWVKATQFGGYNLQAGQRLHFSLSGVRYEAVLLVDTTDAATTAAALDAVLSPFGAGCYVNGGYAWLYSKDPAGTMEVHFGGANDLLRCETGVKSRRLPYGTAEGSHSLVATATDALGRVSITTFSRDLRADGSVFFLEQPGETFSTSVLDAANYTLSLDLAWCRANKKPGYTPAVVSVSTVDTSSVLLTLEQDLTPSVPYTLTVEDVEDALGNLITPNPSTKEFSGYYPEVPANRQFSFYNTMFSGFMRQQDEAEDFTLMKVCAILDEPLFQYLADMDEYTLAKNPATAPIRIIDALLEMYGNTFAFLGLEEGRRRILLEVLVDLWRIRGSEAGVTAALRFFFGFTTLTFEYYWGTHWLLGDSVKSELGVTTVLNSSILRDRFSFLVTVDRTLTADERVQVVRVIEMMKTGHTHLVSVVEPVAPFVPDHWQLPWSELGVDTLLH